MKAPATRCTARRASAPTRFTIAMTALSLATLSLATGCTTHRALGRQTIHQAGTVADIHQQQVLDNLAKFVHDPNSLPSFAHATGGTADVVDQGGSDLGFSWIPTGLDGATLGLGASRQAKQTWTMTPVTDPRKLELMRCAYQKAVANCGKGGPSCTCPDCTKRFNQFYTGSTVKKTLEAVPVPVGKGELPQCELKAVFEVGNQIDAPGSVQDAGTVTSECINPGCCRWFGIGGKYSVPKHCDCIYVGSYCGTYVWVTSSRGRDELSKLTLAVLDYALNSPASTPKKEVTAYLTYDGKPTTESLANLVVKSEVRATDVSAGVIKADVDAAALKKACMRDQLAARLQQLNESAKARPLTLDAQKQLDASRSDIKNQMQALATPEAEFLRGIPDPTFVPSESEQQRDLSTGPNLLLLQQQLETVR